jgi:hypothetical protein
MFGASAMPFKSQAQRRKFAELLVKGEISNETFEEWNRETGRRKLPERVAPRSPRPKRPRAKAGVTPAKKGKRRARPR